MTPTPFGLHAPRRGWDTVVHLGAGEGHAWLGSGARIARRCVLVEGDGDTAARLRVRMRGQGDITIVERVAGPVSGTGRWHRHNVPGFDGLVRQGGGGKAGRYPRLLCTGQRTVAVQALGELLDECLVDGAADGLHALVIDVPLPNLAWAAARAAAALARFHGVSVTAAAGPEDAGAVPADLADALAAAGFIECRGRGSGAAAVFERDTAALRTRAATLEAEVRRLRERQAASDQQHAEMRLAIARADSALRALDPLLRPEDDQAST